MLDIKNIRVGDTVWVVGETGPEKVRVKLLGADQIAYENECLGLKAVSCDKVFDNKEDAFQEWNESSTMIFCREVDRVSGEVSVYPVNMEISGRNIFVLSIRGRYNPELIYCVCGKKFFDDNKEAIKDMDVLEEMINEDLVVQI